MVTIASPNSGAIVSTSLIRRSSCSTLSRCRLLYALRAGHLGDHLVDVHAQHRIAVEQLPELGRHGMQHDLLALASTRSR